MKRKSYYNGSTIFIQPGSVGATTMSDVQNFGEFISLPLFTIDNGEVNLTYIDIPTYKSEYSLNMSDLKKERVKPLVLKIDKDYSGDGLYNYQSIEDYTEKLKIPTEVLKVIELSLFGRLSIENFGYIV